MHSMEVDMTESTKKQTAVISDKLTNGSPQKVFQTQEEVWDRTPIMSRMNSMECWDYTIELECLNGPQDLQLAAELGKTLLERNKELENLLRSHQRKCEDQKQEIEYLTKQNIVLKEVNDSRLQIYETLEVSIRDLEVEKHGLMVQTSNDKKLIKSLKQNIESLEQRCDELTKQIDDMAYNLESEKHKNERLREISHETPAPVKTSNVFGKSRHTSSASEPETEEASTPTNPTKSFTNCGQNSTAQLPFMNYSHDYSSIQPIYSLDSISHDSGFKTGSSSNSADHDELLKIMNELEETKQQYLNEHLNLTELEHQLSAVVAENRKLKLECSNHNTADEMKSVHDELSFLEEVRQGQMCTRCLKNFDSRMVPTENNSFVGTDDDDDQSLMDLLNNTSTNQSPTVYRSAVTIKDEDAQSQTEDPKSQLNPYKDLVEKYEKLLELKRNSGAKQNNESAPVAAQPPSLQDELLNSGDFSSFNTKYTSDDEKKTSTGARRKTPTDFSEAETNSSGFSDETSTKATQTDDSNPASFLFSIADGEDCKFSLNIYDDSTPVETRFRDRPRYRELFKEIFTVLKKAAENKEEGEKLPLLDDEKKVETEESKVPPVTPTAEEMPCDFDSQSIMSSAISENSVAISECITKTERKKAKSHKKQVAKDEMENKPPSAVQMIAGKLVTPYNRVALDLMALNAKKRSRRSRQRSKDKYGSGRDSSACSNASSISNQACSSSNFQDIDSSEAGDASTLTRNRRGRRRVVETFSTLGASEWNGDSITVYNRSSKGKNPANFHCRPPMENVGDIEFKHSAASHELKKLKKLDLSYAEVLRQADRRQRRWK